MSKTLLTLNYPQKVILGEASQHYGGFTALWRSYNEKNPGTHGQDCNLNYVFANRSREEESYPLTAQEVADAQRVDASIKHCFKSNHVFDKDFDIRLVDKTSVVCKNGRMVIPKPLQRRAVLWFHHYLQHPGHTRLEEKNASYNVLERYANYHPVNNKVMQGMPSQ